MQATPTQNVQPLEVATLPDALLMLRTVSAVTGLSASTIFRKTAAGEFPEPVRMGARCTRWRAGDVRDWCVSRTAQRVQPAAK